MQKIDKVVALVAEFFVDEEFSREEIAGVVREAYEVADVDFGAEEAARAAEDFEWPEEVLTRDSHKALSSAWCGRNTIAKRTTDCRMRESIVC